jgi:hypothetical protein
MRLVVLFSGSIEFAELNLTKAADIVAAKADVKTIAAPKRRCGYFLVFISTLPGCGAKWFSAGDKGLYSALKLLLRKESLRQFPQEIQKHGTKCPICVQGISVLLRLR